MKQNEIWLINLDPTIGAEIKKTRPAVIINDNALGKLPLEIARKIGAIDDETHEKIKIGISKVLSITS
jgi:mRNA-degrading endonuclease toxin of MazEF toxin-antitoxin module